jgi:hypothetical protein
MLTVARYFVTGLAGQSNCTRWRLIRPTGGSVTAIWCMHMLQHDWVAVAFVVHMCAATFYKARCRCTQDESLFQTKPPLSNSELY